MRNLRFALVSMVFPALLAGERFVNGAPPIAGDGDGGGTCVGILPWQDCNANGIDDRCDISCSNKWGKCKSCLLAADCGGSADVNANQIPDECENDDDCDNNGVSDDCDLDSNFCCTAGLGEVCGGLFSAYTGQMTPLGVSAHLYNLGAIPYAVGPVTLSVYARGDLDAADEFVHVRINDIFLGAAFVTNGGLCPTVPNEAVFMISADQWNQYIDNGGTDHVGSASIELCGVGPIDPNACSNPGSFVSAMVEYTTANDCNANGVVDECDPTDGDGDGVPQTCDQCVGHDDRADHDFDGVPNGCDQCPGFDDGDNADGDSYPDDCETCDDDPNKSAPGVCGCGVADTDADSDGTADCLESCDNDPNKTEPGVCGCGVPDVDSDGDGAFDCNDECPNDPRKTVQGPCPCGVSNISLDDDSIADCVDPISADGPRYIALRPFLMADASGNIALRFTSPDYPCVDKYVDFDFVYAGVQLGKLVATPVYRTKEAWGTVRLRNTDIVPLSYYRCDYEINGGGTGTLGTTRTSKWGDVVGQGSVNGEWSPPNGIVNVLDISAVADAAGGAPNAVPFYRADLRGWFTCNPDRLVDAFDTNAAQQAFSGQDYPCFFCDEDLCPNDPDKIDPGLCGCGVADTDADGDGIPHCNDQCDNDPNKIVAGVCGCGVSDIDLDNDGLADCHDPISANGPRYVALRPAQDPGVIGSVALMFFSPDYPCVGGYVDFDVVHQGVQVAKLVSGPVYRTAAQWGTVHVRDVDLVPNVRYSCTFMGGSSGTLDTSPTQTSKWGDVVGQGSANGWTAPNGVVNILDISALVDADNGASTAPAFYRADLIGWLNACLPDRLTDGFDVNAAVDAFTGAPYPCIWCGDLCPSDPYKSEPGICGCGVADTDSDGDAAPDCIDLCPADPAKTAPGQCGCGTPDTDSDGDATPDCNDLCSADPDKVSPGQCGCGFSDEDSDGDGTADCIDECDSDPDKIVEGVCGCNEPDEDADGDGALNCQETCDDDPKKTSPGLCGCGVSDINLDNDDREDCHDPIVAEGARYIALTPLEDSSAAAVGSLALLLITPDEGCLSKYVDFGPVVGGLQIGILVDNPVFKTAAQWGTVHVKGGDIVPFTNYSALFQPLGSPSPLGTLETSPSRTPKWGDVVGAASGGEWGPPDGIINVMDISAVSSAQGGVPGAPALYRADLTGFLFACPTDQQVNVFDTQSVLNAFQGNVFPCVWCADACPLDPNKMQPGICGCGVADTDSDGDGLEDCHDLCPTDAAKFEPGQCGCGNSDVHSDADGVADCAEDCDLDSLKLVPGQCGCGNPDTDTDNDGTADCNDLCPGDPTKTGPGICGCGVSDNDTDQDGTADCDDLCAADPVKVDPGLCGCGVSDLDLDGDSVEDCHDPIAAQGPRYVALRPEFESGAVGSFALWLFSPDQPCVGGYVDFDSLYAGIQVGKLVETPVYRTAAQWGAVYVRDEDLVPYVQYSCSYEIYGGGMDILGTSPTRTSKWGDVVGAAVGREWGPPDGIVNVMDISAVAGCPPGGLSCPPFYRRDLTPWFIGCLPDRLVDAFDIQAVTKAFTGQPYPCPWCADLCPLDPNKSHPGECGCGVPDTDTDSDSTPDCDDDCPSDPAKIEPGLCGCGAAELVPCVDECPDDPDKTAPGLCGCGISDEDSDGDGTPNCHDECEDDPLKTAPGLCGCDVSDQDSDSDGTPDCLDECDANPRKILAGDCGCSVSDIDLDGDGIKDCFDPVVGEGPKYLSITPANGTSTSSPIALRVSSPDDIVCLDMYVDFGPVVSGFQVGDLVAGAVYRTKEEWGTVHVQDIDIVPNTEYVVEFHAESQTPTSLGSSTTRLWGDVVGSGGGLEWSAPNGVVNVMDISATADAQAGAFRAVEFYRADHAGFLFACPVDHSANVFDTYSVVNAFQGELYPCVDCSDACPLDPTKIEPGQCGCGYPDNDSDLDGTADCVDSCPADATKTDIGQCGCGNPDTDTDSDGTADCLDDCPNDANKIDPGQCGCGNADDHSDSDGVADCAEECDFDPNKLVAGWCGCGMPESDTDGDGNPDCAEDCDLDPAKIVPGFCGCGVSDIDLDDDGLADCIDPVSGESPRYLAIRPTHGTTVTAPIAIRVVSPGLPCLSKYVDFDGSVGGHQLGRLVDGPVYRTRAQWGTVHVTGLNIIPNTTYQVIYHVSGQAALLMAESATRPWGDVVGSFNGIEWSAPDGIVNMNDISAILASDQGLPTAASFYRLDLAGWPANPCAPDQLVDSFDAQAATTAFQSMAFSCPDPCP